MTYYLSQHIGLSISLALGGLGLFLVAIKLMSNSMKTMTTGHMVGFIKKFSTNRWLALGFGILFTTIIQSSDGTVALTIGLIGAGFITLRGAIPFILGANIGTATTALIVWLGADFEFTQYFFLLAFIGGMMYLLIKEEKKSNIAMLIFAIGSIFLGLKVLGWGMKGIAHTSAFKDIINAVSFNSWTSLFSSTALTGLMQSSSASVTIVQGIYGEGGMATESAIAMVIGANIGTTFTAMIASIGSKKDAKRIALIWLITNLSFALIVLPLMTYYADLVRMIVPNNYAVPTSTTVGNSYEGAAKLQLAVSHIMFNTMLVSVFIWFIGPLAKLSRWIIKDKKTNFQYDIQLSKELLDTAPSLAYESAKNATHTLGKMIHHQSKLYYEYIKEPSTKKYDDIKELSELIDISSKSIYQYLIELGSRKITARISNRQVSLVLTIRNFERINSTNSEIGISLKRNTKKNKETKKREFTMSSQDHAEIRSLYKMILSMTKRSVSLVKKYSSTKMSELAELEEKIEELISHYSKNHVSRKTDNSEFEYILITKNISRIAHNCYKVGKFIRKGKKEIALKKLSDKLNKELSRNY